MSLFNELRRRNVFKVGAAYAVVSWLVVQVASIVMPAFEFPPWAFRSLLGLVAAGFVLAVVVAWIYELTPRGIRRTRSLFEAQALLRSTAPIVSSPTLPSIAVLAFNNRSADPEDAYFADGLADELLSTLGRIREIKVASRTASFDFSGKDVTIEEIAARLDVKNVLSGSVRREGDRIRVTAALDRIDTGDLIWSQTYERNLDSILDIQTDIADSVASAIVPVLSPAAKALIETPPTRNPKAYAYYLRGRDYLRQPGEPETIAGAVEFFQWAIELDADFAEAHAGLCEAHLASYYHSQEANSFREAEAVAERALALDESLWQVHVALGMLYRDSGRLDDAIAELEDAIERQPTAAQPYLELAETLARLRRDGDAEAMFRRAIMLETGYWAVHNAFGNFLWHLYRYDEAIPFYEKVVELAPDSGIGYDNLANAYLALGEYAKAIEVAEASPAPSWWTYSNRGLVHYYQRKFAEAAEDFERAVSLAPDVYKCWGQLGDAYRFIAGKEERSRAAYERAIELAEQRLGINPMDWETQARLNTYYAHSGKVREAEAGLETLFARTSDPTAYYFGSLARLRLGDLERTFEHLRDVSKTGWSHATLKADPDLATLSGNPAFERAIAASE